MEKVEECFQKKLQDFKGWWNKERRNIFFLTILISIIVHFQLYALMITGADTLINDMYHQADVWEAMLLRFGLDFMQAIKGNIVSPILATLISSIFLGITVILTTEIFEIKNKYFKYILAILFAVAPNISATLTFFYCSDAYLFAMLLATLAVFLMKKYENKKWPIFLGGICIALAMGMYQTYLSVTMVLALATLIFDLFQKREIKQVLRNLLRYVIMGIIGVAVFYLLAHLNLALKNLHVSDYSGANEIGIATILNIPQLLPETYRSFFQYFFGDQIIPNQIWGTNWLYIILFGIMLIASVYLVIKNKVYQKVANLILGILFIACLPICFGVIEIVTPDIDIHILMACSMIYIFPIFFKIVERIPKSIFSGIVQLLTVICSLVVAWNYIWQDNASYLALKAMQNQTESTALRMVTRIEQLEGYTPEMPVLILGDLKNNDYFNRDNTAIEAKKIYDRSWGFIAREPAIWRESQDSWRKLLYEHTGVNLNLISVSDSEGVTETEEFKTMKNYPEKDSIKIINGVVVVKLTN